MTDIERAHALVTAHYPEMAPSYTGSPVQIALAAIQSERERAKVLVEALRKIAFARPVGDIDQAKGVRGLVIRMESEALMALAAYGDGHE